MSSQFSWKAVRQSLDKLAKSFNVDNINKLYMKDGLLAIRKPFNVPVTSGPKQGVSVMDLVPQIEQRFNIPQGMLHLANRLDKQTTGVLLFTYTHDMADFIASRYREGLITKTYLAILLGVPKSTRRGTLTSRIEEVRVQDKTMMGVIETGDPNYSEMQGVRSVSTQYRILDNNRKDCCLCQFTTNSGVKHQVRVHALQKLGCPVLGDHKYHDGPAGPQMMPLRVQQMLHFRGSVQQSGKNKFRPWERALVPMHLHAHTVRIPGLPDIEPIPDEQGDNKKVNKKTSSYLYHQINKHVDLQSKTGLLITSPLPNYFDLSLDLLNLHPMAEELEEQAQLHSLIRADDRQRMQMLEERSAKDRQSRQKTDMLKEYIQRKYGAVDRPKLGGGGSFPAQGPTLGSSGQGPTPGGSSSLRQNSDKSEALKYVNTDTTNANASPSVVRTTTKDKYTTNI